MHTAPPPPYAVPVEGAAPFGRRLALVDRRGRLVRPPELAAVGRFHPDGRGGWTAPAADLAGRWGYLDGQGAWRAEPHLEHAGDFDDFGLSPFLSGGLWGYADTTGAPAVTARFTEAGPFRHGLAVVRTPDGVGYAAPDGTVAIGGHYLQAGLFGPVGLGAVRLADGLCGYVDRAGRMAVPARFDGARPFNAAGTAPVLVGTEWGLIDTAGEWVVEPRYRILNAFDDSGLAYAGADTADGSSTGYVDARGNTVLRRENEMDDVPACGLVKVGDGHRRGFRDAAGRWAVPAVYEWADRFDAGGACVARACEPPAWGVLRTDGRFTPVPHPEPVTDDDGWITGFDGGHGLAPFLTADGAVAHVDREGRDVCRTEATADGAAATLRDASGAAVWSVAAEAGTFEPPEAWLSGGVRHCIDHDGAWDGDTAEAARQLLAAPARPFHPCSLIFGGDDPYDLSDLDAHDQERVRDGALAVIASKWLAGEWIAEYPFLLDRTQACFDEITRTLERRLRAAFGDPLPWARSSLRSGDGEWSATWEVDGRHLVLQSYAQIGDGDTEFQVWLAAVDT
ncbi:WG repeat-containing protein [Streptomyces globosus]|uniref:WG repeat-containing protein n=2 Tax=Streptomyces TaxID=1883 RepID=UPI0038087803